MSLQVNVEVTNNLTKTNNGKDMQDCYIDLGGKYPEAVSRFVGSEGVLPAGKYVATKGRVENFRPVVDLRHLTPAAPPSPGKA